MVGSEATVYIPLDVEFIISLVMKEPSPSAGHEEGPSIKGPGLGQCALLRPEAYSVAHIVDPPARLARGISDEQALNVRRMLCTSVERSRHAGRYFRE